MFFFLVVCFWAIELLSSSLRSPRNRNGLLRPNRFLLKILWFMNNNEYWHFYRFVNLCNCLATTESLHPIINSSTLSFSHTSRLKYFFFFSLFSSATTTINLLNSKNMKMAKTLQKIENRRICTKYDVCNGH